MLRVVRVGAVVGMTVALLVLVTLWLAQLLEAPWTLFAVSALGTLVAPVLYPAGYIKEGSGWVTGLIVDTISVVANGMLYGIACAMGYWGWKTLRWLTGVK